MTKKLLFFLGFFIIILLIVFGDLILNLSTNLLDWRDYPYIIWVIFQSITHITSLDFANFFETNAFYPHKLTLMFSDILLPQAIILLPFFLLTNNLVLSFNITFIITFILNYLSLHLFWKQIFKKDLIAFFGSLFFVFSPFLHFSLDHFQMLSYWPFFFSFFLILKNEEKNEKRNLIIIGLFITIQFLASVYLSVYLLFAIFIFYILKFTSLSNARIIFFKLLVIFFVFLLTSGIFIKGYMDMKKTYDIKRDFKEYITYSAHMSDYIFTSQIKSVIHSSPVMQIWNKADKNWSLHSSFPGFLIFILSLFALFKISRNQQALSISLELNKQKAFFLILIVLGFFFSLGPRLNFNGNYAHIPLPYSLVIEFAPFAETLRVPARWSFIFFFGLVYFSLITLSRIKTNNPGKILLLFIFVVLLLEYLPISIQSVRDSYKTSDYEIIKNICSQDRKVLLEVPLTHLDVYPNAIEGLTYISKVELSSTYHHCFIVNGYSGYDLPQIFQLKENLYNTILDRDPEAFLSYINAYKIDIVKFNPHFFIKELRETGIEFIDLLSKQEGVSKIDDNIFLIQRGKVSS